MSDAIQITCAVCLLAPVVCASLACCVAFIKLAISIFKG
ncbi:Hypothetical protein DSVG11_2714 [Desulfovibrio sp. G11]|nr:Hypothetical protein DSVG11_2714 [Desulfovibrio sp. G11]